MTRNEFISELETILNIPDGSIASGANLDSYAEWDSLAMFSVFSLFKTIGVPISFVQINDTKKVSDLINLAQDKLQ
jgi:acyl carrier protein